MKKLPIDAIVPQVKQALGNCNALIIKATPGSGKTTRVPPALIDVLREKSRVIVLEPRRLAARLAAERVASELGVPCGDLVGYHIRFEQKLSASTRILFMTEGMLMRYLIADPELKDTAAVILDEFHERHLHTDVALAAVRRLQSTVRKDLKLVVMSATLDVGALTKALDRPESVETTAEAHPLAILHEASATQSESVEISLQRTPERIGSALVRAMEHHRAQGFVPGHALVFLPGAADIDRAAAALEGFVRRCPSDDPLKHAVVLKLHGSMPPADQKRVFDPSRVMKIILATNIAESSLTVDGVNIVIDAGLGKFPSQSLWAGLPVLKLQRVSQASCTQRAGRAARQGPGVVVRLFSEADFRGRPGFDLPEILRLDLTQTLLEVACVVDRPGQGPALDLVSQLTWVDPPENSRVGASVSLLSALGAVDGDGHVTQVGHEMARYPLHPRLSRIVEEGKRRDLLAAAVTFAAKVSEQAQGGRAGGYGFSALFQQIASLAGEGNLQPVEIPSSVASLQGFTPVILSGYGDRVARREGEQNHASSYRLADGRTFAIKQSGSVLPEWLCLIDADVSPSDPSRIMPREWVALAMTPDFSALRAVEGLWKEGSEVDWDTGATGAGGRVRGFQRIRYGALVLKEIPAAVDPDLAAARLRDELRRAWPRPFADAEELHRWDQRIRILADLNGESPLLDLSGGDFEFLLDAMVEGKSSFAEIAERNLGDYVKDLLGYADAERVSRECPEKMELSSGRSALVHYRTGQPPWVEGKIQEFFGGKPLPAVCGGKAKLVVHLLAPNNRPVQVTSDLEGFWTNHYPALRRELSRDYPRHFWPEDPRTAEARVFLRPRR